MTRGGFIKRQKRVDSGDCDFFLEKKPYRELSVTTDDPLLERATFDDSFDNASLPLNFSKKAKSSSKECKSEDRQRLLSQTDEDSMTVDVEDFILSRNDTSDASSTFGHSGLFGLAVVFGVLGLVSSTFNAGINSHQSEVSTFNSGMGLRAARREETFQVSGCDVDSLDYDAAAC